MKKIYLLTFLAFLGCKPFDLVGYYEEPYKGNPKVVAVSTFEASMEYGEVKQGALKRTEVYLFDKKNRKYKDYLLNSAGDTISVCQKKYYKKDRKIISNCSTNGRQDQIIYYLNKNNKETEVIGKRFGEELSFRKIYEYKGNGVDFIEYIYNKNNDLRDKTLVLHNVNGQRIKIVSFDVQTGKIKGETINRIDKDGNVYERKYYKRGKIVSSSKNQFDKNNNPIFGEKEVYHNSDTTVSFYKISYKYDDKQNITKKIYTKSDWAHIEETEITY